jgi:hypothetical protein
LLSISAIKSWYGGNCHTRSSVQPRKTNDSGFVLNF